MTFNGWVTLAVIAACFGTMVSNRIAPEVIMMGGLTLLFALGILSPDQTIAGFANEGLITVGVLYVVIAGLRDTGAVSWIVQYLLGRPRSTPHAQLRMMIPIAFLSAFVNHNPVVAMMIPAVQDWAKRYQLSASKLLIPLSFSAIAGGACTLIGTNTSLVMNSLLVKDQHAGLTMFELAWIGFPVTLAVIVMIVALSRWLLPERIPAITQFSDARGYTVEMTVDAHGPLVGKTIEQAGLRHLPGLYLVEIDRGAQILPAPTPLERLQADDRLVFAGVVESVVDLQKINGLKPATNQVFKLTAPRPERCLVEAVISHSCPIVGKSIRAGRFRSLYNAAVIAVSRRGEQIKTKIGDIILEPGDTLLLEAHPSFVLQQRYSRDFYLVSQIEESTPLRHEKAPIAILIMLAMVLVVAFGMMSLLKAAMLAGGLMLVTRCTSARLARRSVDWQILIVIGASIGVGEALRATGAAQAIALHLLTLVGNDPLMILVMIYAVTAIFTNIIAHTTAAVLMYPIATALSQKLGLNLMPFIITITVGATMSFATPIGQMTNLMVLGPGGYRFNDYFKLGILLTIAVGILVVAIVPQVWPF